MQNRLTKLALTSMAALCTNGCSDALPELDTSLMGDGTSNVTGLNGYWWTYVDRTLSSEVTPNTGKEEPTDPFSTKLRTGFSRGEGLGMELDGTHAAYHVTGKVVPVPTTLETDGYWSELYKELCQDGDCGEQKYPAAGVGFGFKPKNAPLGTDAFDNQKRLKKGIGFRIKYGSEHAKVGGTYQPVSISAPMDLTDAPDPSFGDEFGTFYAGLNSTLYPDRDSNANYPICSFPNSFKPDGTDTYNANNKTCFCNLTKALDVTDQWQTVCVEWAEFGSPGWGGLDSALVPDGGIAHVVPERLIKIQFDAYKPSANEAEAAFDIWLDDVRLLGDDDWDAYCSSERL